MYSSLSSYSSFSKSKTRGRRQFQNREQKALTLSTPERNSHIIRHNRVQKLPGIEWPGRIVLLLWADSRELSNPNVTEADRLPVVLQQQRQLFWVRLVRGTFHIGSGTRQL